MTYQEFIQSIKDSRPNVWFEYSERHHIIPRCLGGTDDEENLIYLTLKEHFMAHKFLCEEYPDNYNLAYALMYMSADKRHECTPEEYEAARMHVIGKSMPKETREKISIALRKYEKTPEHCKNISESRKGKGKGDRNAMRDPKVAAKMSKLLSGENNPMYGKTGDSHPLYGCHYVWMTNGSSNKRADTDEEILELKSQGYKEGFTQSFNFSEESLERRKEARSKVDYHRICRLCGREFISKSGNAKYCGCHLTH